MTDLLSEVFKSINDSYTKLYPLEAIWTDKTKVVRNGEIVETNRIAAPDQIKVISGYLVSVDNGPTHEIVKLLGTLANTHFEIECKNLETGESEIVKLLP